MELFFNFTFAFALTTRYDSCFALERYGFLSQFKIKGRQIFVLKPNTFMNLSGKAVKYYLQLKKIKIDNILVKIKTLQLMLHMLI